MKRSLFLLFGLIVIVLLIFLGYFFYINKQDEVNNYKEINIEQSIKLGEKNNIKSREFIYRVENNSKGDLELNFATGYEIDVEIKNLSQKTEIKDQTISIRPFDEKAHHKILRQGEEWEYKIDVNLESLPKGEYQLSVRFIPSNAQTQNTTEIFFEN
ncbi:tyrosine recombinase [Bacillus sp. NRRL B-14911]|uniref:BsuPI-related putative proteinase inhibitor n=1 Tax=Bacillus sp. NRRL B-14911 TaxID=313627 RepID=UPI00006B5967|nr:BsuPI-related putative proteinase inhibitor [Bacillus sp. NRRL B-14911]EAR66245.1 tyrosine recombinase [Bacillus sp. NRRL B-14911]